MKNRFLKLQKWILVKKFRETDLYDFTSFFGLDFKKTSIKRIQYHTLMMIQKFFRTLPNPINAQKIFFQTFMNTFNKTLAEYYG